MKFEIHNLGCKVNQYEACSIRSQLINAGYTPVTDGEKPDIVVINSCTVTSTADKKSRQAIRHFKRDGARVVVLTGCVPQAYPKAALDLIEADVVAGNNSNTDISAAIKKFLETGKRVICTREHKSGDKFTSCHVSEFAEKTRATVKIQDGCNRFCSYCAIPSARGRARSKPLNELTAELYDIAKAGYKEIVFAGINLSAFGCDTGCSLADAVEIACSVPGIIRVRLGSLEPDHITDEMIARFAAAGKDGTARLCPQFHISLQSGCDSTLKRMNRHYNCAEYDLLCQKLRAAFTDCTLTTDVMTGFPGETDEDFQESLSFVKKIGFEKVHVFPYSPREGTRAATMDNLPERSVREERCRKMIAAGDKIRSSYFASCVNKRVSVLFESTERDGYISGYTENYTPIKAKAPHELCGAVVECIITGASNDCCIGEPIAK